MMFPLGKQGVLSNNHQQHICFAEMNLCKLYLFKKSFICFLCKGWT